MQERLGIERICNHANVLRDVVAFDENKQILAYEGEIEN
jgi:hypothetical protein